MYSRALPKTLFLFLTLFSFETFAQELARICDGDIRGLLVSRFATFHAQPLSGAREGWNFVTPHPTGKRAFRMRAIGLELAPKAENYAYRGNQYLLANVGFYPFKNEATYMNFAFARHLLNHPHENFELQLAKSWTSADEYLHDWHYVLLNAVKRVYRDKPYLNEEDFYLMDQIGAASSKTDILVLLGGPGPGKMRPARTMQVRYYGDRDFFRPTLRGILESQGLGVDETGDRLPYQYRLNPEDAAAFIAQINARFARETSCEMLRYVEFENIPVPMVDRFMLSIFMLIKERGMKTIFISTNAISLRRFARYGFRNALAGDGRMPVRQTLSPEYLGVLEVDSPIWVQVMTDLQRRVAGVTPTN